MSGDTEPFIQTVGTVDHRDHTDLADEITRTVGNASPRVLDSESDKTKDGKLETHSDTVKGSGTQRDATSPPKSNEPGVVGQIRTVGSVGSGGGDDAAKDSIESRQGR